MDLYTYQQEVVERALQGDNIIIWLPTGGGKTRAAVYVAKRHLETTPRAKVVVLVNMVHLVDQHYSKEFKPHLDRDYTLVPVSGETEQKDFLGKVIQDSNVVICTAQILYNAMTNDEETKHVELSDITLLIIDECHHTQKESVYNKIMRCYVEKKLKGEQRLPQILGLTASPGQGCTDSGKGCGSRPAGWGPHICANLDSAIVSTKKCTTELKKNVPRPIKRFDIAEKRPEDPFGQHLKWMMQEIHGYMTLPQDFTLRECGTQEYEADVVALEKRGVKENNRLLAQCAIHLRQYNDALLINDTLQMMDAYCYLEEFYNKKSTKAIDGTDNFLLGLFQENKEELRKLAMDSRFENPKMAKLESVLLKQFCPDEESRGILFSKTRGSIHCLNNWVLNNRALQEAGIKAAILTGAGNGNNSITQNEQADTICKFRQGIVNLLISTSVAEEGLDIPECNLVVRYGLLTNEISQQQASGRARAKDSQYSVVTLAGGREQRREILNEHLEELTGKAIAKVQDMSPQEFRAKITELQRQAICSWKAAENQTAEKKSLDTLVPVSGSCVETVSSLWLWAATLKLLRKATMSTSILSLNKTTKLMDKRNSKRVSRIGSPGKISFAIMVTATSTGDLK
ncbi:hypothetical protein Q5P01_017058 [Channa striata]|uniref:RNA helicase n=1 Tax=Channa striata TaxID=64152 RepID=A0AA88M8K8_CHASR|nr:hypothetical protein Q5P01_017058 [Channa striata]